MDGLPRHNMAGRSLAHQVAFCLARLGRALPGLSPRSSAVLDRIASLVPANDPASRTEARRLAMQRSEEILESDLAAAEAPQDFLAVACAALLEVPDAPAVSLPDTADLNAWVAAVREAQQGLQASSEGTADERQGRIARLQLLQLWLMQCELRRVYFDKGLTVETDSQGLVVRT